MGKIIVLLFLTAFLVISSGVYAQSPTESADSEEATESAEIITSPVPVARPDLTQKSEETTEPLEKLLEKQELGLPIIRGWRKTIQSFSFSLGI